METRTKNQNEQQKATKSIFHSHFHSFAPVLDQWKVVYIKSNEKPERATTGNEKQWKAAKSYEEQQKATTDIRAGKTKTGKKKPRRATKGTKSPNGNQALALIWSLKNRSFSTISKYTLLQNKRERWFRACTTAKVIPTQKWSSSLMKYAKRQKLIPKWAKLIPL